MRFGRPIARAGRASALAVLAVAPGWAQRVEVRANSIYLVDRSGGSHRITESGDDSAPALSKDASKVVYVRTFPSRIPGSNGSISELRVHDIRTAADEALLSAPVEIDGGTYFGFGTPQFSADGSTVYFVFDWSVATRGLARLDLRTHSIRFVMPAIAYFSVFKGKYVGDLVVQQRRPKLSGGFYYWYYLFTPEGREVGVVGDTLFDVGLFLDPDG